MAKNKNKKNEERGMRYILGLVLLGLCLCMGLSLVSYDWMDIGVLIQPPNIPPNNLFGTVGAWLSFMLFMLFGVGGYLVPAWCLVLGLRLLISGEEKVWPCVTWTVVMMLSLAAVLSVHGSGWPAACAKLNLGEDAGGIFGRLLIEGFLVKWLGAGAGVLAWTLFIIATAMVVGVQSIMIAARHVGRGMIMLRRKMSGAVAEQQERRRESVAEERKAGQQRERDERLARRRERVMAKQTRDQEAEKEEEEEPAPPVKAVKEKPPKPAPEPAPVAPVSAPVQPELIPPPERAPAPPAPDMRQSTREDEEEGELDPVVVEQREYHLPDLNLLDEVRATKNKGIKADTGTTAKILVETLAEFGIEADVVNVERGPVVTRYELLPAPGVRVERISGLSNNLALSLKATSVRVQAPIPGKGVVGVEVPNMTANMVYLRQILESEVWQSGRAKLPLVLGQDVGGGDLIADLAEMPHLLIAGATGAGKTVCMNSVLAGLLMSRTPTELRLMLVDPKIVEFSVYNNLPHLVVPVITNPKKVALGLRWAINEMERRYRMFARCGVRNIESYNHREVPKRDEALDGGAVRRAADELPETVPYIVIVIDELADLMLADQAEIENCIARLAQLSRAVGIHMILSTQRPSVNVITGTIKANFPARIAFQVAQKVDSRTILDTVGAEKLLGRGDMLFHPPGTSKVVRAQGAMTSDQAIRNIVNCIKAQGEPTYELEIKAKIEGEGQDGKKDDASHDSEDDELLSKAVEIIRETRRASTSSLQRRLRIGYTRAARMMDILEERGIVGPPRGSDPREILIDLDGEIPNNAEQDEAEPEAEPQPEAAE